MSVGVAAMFPIVQPFKQDELYKSTKSPGEYATPLLVLVFARVLLVLPALLLLAADAAVSEAMAVG
jgi:hypothetical protein